MMGYYFHLARQYMWKNKARTAYSILGILLSFILCFGMLIAFYSYWDYDFMVYYREYPYELQMYPNEAQEATPDLIRTIRALEKDEAVEKLTVNTKADTYSGRRAVFTADLEVGEKYFLWVKLADTGNLQKSASVLGEKYGFSFHIRQDVARYLRQDESASTAMLNLMITMAVAVFGGFSVAVLRNTMMIAVAERVRDYGLLRCVGMSEGQLRLLLFAEGLVMSLLASLLGMSLGYGGMKLIEPWIRENLGFSKLFAFHFYPRAAVLTTLLCIGVTLFSLIEPSRQAGLVTPLDALHGIYTKSGKRKKKKATKGGLLEKLFGAPGFYAKRNMQNSRSHQGPVFLAMFFSFVFLLTVLSYTGTLERTMKRDLDGSQVQYKESLVPVYNLNQNQDPDPEREEEICRYLEEREDVTDAMVMTSSIRGLGSRSYLGADPYLKELYEEGKLSYVIEQSYTEGDMEKEAPYLIEGEIDYPAMVAGKGVLVCDTGKDGERLTDYRVGDTITMLSTKGAGRAKKAFTEALLEVSEKHAMFAYVNGRGEYVRLTDGEVCAQKEKLPSEEVLAEKVKRGVEDRTYPVLWEEMAAALSARGYDCAERVSEEKRFVIVNLLEVLKEIEYERGAVDRYTIMGILSDEVYVRDLFWQDKNMRLVLPMDLVTQRMEEVAAAERECGEALPSDGGLYYLSSLNLRTYDVGYRTEIAIRRDMELLDNELARLVQENEGLRERYYFSNMLGNEDYYEGMRMMKVFKAVVTLLGAFIITICLVQIVNTLQGNMRLRRKELWLYEMVGMDRRARFRMQLTEHGLGALMATLLGMICSLGASHLFIKVLLDYDGDRYVYYWPIPIAILLEVLVMGILVTVNLLELKVTEEGKRE